MKARWLALIAGWVNSFVSAGSTRAATRALDPQNAAAAAAATAATATRLVANGESILPDVGAPDQRPGLRIDHDRLAAAHQRPVHDARWRHHPLVAALDQIGNHPWRQPVFHHDAAAADVAEPWRVDRLLEVE